MNNIEIVSIHFDRSRDISSILSAGKVICHKTTGWLFLVRHYMYTE